MNRTLPARSLSAAERPVRNRYNAALRDQRRSLVSTVISENEWGGRGSNPRPDGL